MVHRPTSTSSAILNAVVIASIAAMSLPGCGPGQPAAETSTSSPPAPQPVEQVPAVAPRTPLADALPGLPVESSTFEVNAGIQQAMPALLGALGESSPAEEAPPTPPAIDPAQLKQARDAFALLMTPDVDTSRWEQAHQSLMQLGEQAIPVLVEELRHEDSFHRETAAMTLALMGTPPQMAIEPLKQALTDDSQFVRANVATALVLSPSNSRDAVPVLVSLLNAEDPQLRLMAASNLAAVGEEAAPHVAELAKTIVDETSPDVLLPVVELLGKIGPAAADAVPQLKRIEHEQTGEVRNAATHALSLIQTPSN
jgi:HEAT repeat protein